MDVWLAFATERQISSAATLPVSAVIISFELC